jgi:beta-glucosidase
LHNGAPIEMPWADKVSAILEMYLGGQAVGGAAVDILYGAANPSGKLAETFPKKLAHNPSYLYFPGDGNSVKYNEGIYVGYRFYDTVDRDVLFPFGYGLSYTTFEYSNPRAVSGGDTAAVYVDVTNTGSVSGKEAVQIYVRSAHQGQSRPAHELKGFEKVALQPGETKTVQFNLIKRDFAYWEERIHNWHTEPGAYVIEIAASSRDIRFELPIDISGRPLNLPVTSESTVGDIMAIPAGKQIIAPFFKMFGQQMGAGDSGGEGFASMFEMFAKYMPLRSLQSFAGASLTDEVVNGVISAINEAQLKE